LNESIISQTTGNSEAITTATRPTVHNVCSRAL
jgi:hypothetical protein